MCCGVAETQDSSNMYFCFRWLLIHFKREFSYPDTMRLWEVGLSLMDIVTVTVCLYLINVVTITTVCCNLYRGVGVVDG